MNFRYKNTHIKVSPQVYEPSEDSFLLAEAVLSGITGKKILEIGCGSGIVSALIKARTEAKVIGIDVNPHAAKCTKENGVDAVVGDLLSCVKGKFDMIIFNPPYLPTGKEERTKDWVRTAIDGGEDGRRVIFRFLEQAGNHLAEDGRVMMVVSSLAGIEQVRSKMEEVGFEVEEKACERFMFERLAVLSGVRN